MKYLLTGREMKNWEKKAMEKYKVPSLLLMERAAQAVVRELLGGGYDLHKVLVVCGTGNNGGDGLAVARMLKVRNIAAEVCLLGEEDRMTAETKAQLEMYQAIFGKMVTSPNCGEYTVIVDALLGIGCNRDVTGIFEEMIEGINASKTPVVSVDVPSGISADTGKVCKTAVKADATVTFFTEKLGMMLYPGRDFCGRILVEDLELPFDVTEECKIMTYDEGDLKRLPVRSNHSHKGTFGRVLVVAGSPRIAGAAYLAAAAAYRMGAGLVKIYTTKENQVALQTLLPEALLEIYNPANVSKVQLAQALSWADVVVVGPGLGTDWIAEHILKYVIYDSSVPVVVDADGINILAKHKEWICDKKAEMILTPHVLEMARLIEGEKTEVLEDEIKIAQEFVENYPVTLVLKDSRTVVAKENEKVYLNTSGNSGMATGGSGDVLAGIIGGLLAQRMEPGEAARLGVYLHGKAGDAAASLKGAYGMTARDILDGMLEVTKV